MRTIKQAQKLYEKICLEIEQLNEEAFSLEQEILYLRAKEK